MTTASCMVYAEVVSFQPAFTPQVGAQTITANNAVIRLGTLPVVACNHVRPQI